MNLFIFPFSSQRYCPQKQLYGYSDDGLGLAISSNNLNLAATSLIGVFMFSSILTFLTLHIPHSELYSLIEQYVDGRFSLKIWFLDNQG